MVLGGKLTCFLSLEPEIMQSESRILEDIAKLTTSAVGTAQGVLRDVEDMVRTRVERWADSMDLVSRDEFEAVKAMAAAARVENETLLQRLEALEGKVAESSKKAKKPVQKPAAKSSRRPVKRAPKSRT